MLSETERAARVALALAGVEASLQRVVLEELPRRLDRAEAMARRDAAIRAAHRIVGSPRRLAEQLHEFYAAVWPRQRHLIEPPADATPLRHAFFMACRCAEDAGADVPRLRQLRNIIL